MDERQAVKNYNADNADRTIKTLTDIIITIVILNFIFNLYNTYSSRHIYEKTLGSTTRLEN